MRRLQLAVLATAMQLAQGWSESLLNNINDVCFLSLSLSIYIYMLFGVLPTCTNICPIHRQTPVNLQMSQVSRQQGLELPQELRGSAYLAYQVQESPLINLHRHRQCMYSLYRLQSICSMKRIKCAPRSIFCAEAINEFTVLGEAPTRSLCACLCLCLWLWLCLCLCLCLWLMKPACLGMEDECRKIPW